MQHEYTSLKGHYKFSQEDIDVLTSLKPKMELVLDDFISGFYNHVWDYGDAASFLKNKQIVTRHQAKIEEWFLLLFSGKYNMTYFMQLYRIGEVHVRIGLPTHYVNSSFSYVRTFLINQVENIYCEKEDRIKALTTVDKILDMNLDVLTSSYREEELGKFLSLSHIEKGILINLKRFTSYINFFLAGALAIVSLFAIGLFSYDVYLLFFGGKSIEKGILTVLGSLLVLWAAIELIHEEIKHLQGKGFAIGAFIMLAMAALIRKILIYSLSAEKNEQLIIAGGVIVGLAVAYWLVEKSQQKTGH